MTFEQLVHRAEQLAEFLDRRAGGLLPQIARLGANNKLPLMSGPVHDECLQFIDAVLAVVEFRLDALEAGVLHPTLHWYVSGSGGLHRGTRESSPNLMQSWADEAAAAATAAVAKHHTAFKDLMKQANTGTPAFIGPDEWEHSGKLAYKPFA